MVLIFILHSLFSFSQSWPKYYGEPNRHDYSRDITETYDKGMLICGGYFNDDFSGAWLIKTDINGDTLWEKILDCDGYNYLNAVHQAMDGGLLACGAIQLGQSDQMPFVIKLNSCGEKLWCKAFVGTEVNPWAQDIKETSSGEIIVLVNQYGENNVEDMDLFKLNPQGELLWRKPYCSGSIYPESAIPTGISLIRTLNDNYLISGDVYWEDPWNPGGAKGIRNLFILIDSMGTEQWVLPYGLQDSIYGSAKQVIEVGNNTFVGVGSYWPTEIEREMLVMKFNSLGIELDYNIINANMVDTNFVKGFFVDFKRTDSLYHFGGIMGELMQGGNPVVEFKTDTNIFSENLNIYNYIQYNNNAEPYTLIKSFDNKLLSNSTFKESGNWDISLSKLNLDLEYDTLYPGTYTYDSLCTEPGLPQSGFIFLDDCDIITGIDVPSPEEYYAHLRTIPISVYPNPTIGKVNFAMENTQHHNNITLKCFNLMGKQVFETPVASGQTESSTAVQGWPQGMYVAVVYSDGFPVGECKFVVQ